MIHAPRRSRHPRSLRLAVQDVALSRLKHGFDSRRERQSFKGLAAARPAAWQDARNSPYREGAPTSARPTDHRIPLDSESPPDFGRGWLPSSQRALTLRRSSIRGDPGVVERLPALDISRMQRPPRPGIAVNSGSSIRPNNGPHGLGARAAVLRDGKVVSTATLRLLDRF
jgi:hypothetical protein